MLSQSFKDYLSVFSSDLELNTKISSKYAIAKSSNPSNTIVMSSVNTTRAFVNPKGMHCI